MRGSSVIISVWWYSGCSVGSGATGAPGQEVERAVEHDRIGVRPRRQRGESAPCSQPKRPGHPEGVALLRGGVADRPCRAPFADRREELPRARALPAVSNPSGPAEHCRIPRFITATPTVSGPAHAPLPTSSMPATSSCPARQSLLSCARSGLFLVAGRARVGSSPLSSRYLRQVGGGSCRKLARGASWVEQRQCSCELPTKESACGPSYDRCARDGRARAHSGRHTRRGSQSLRRLLVAGVRGGGPPRRELPDQRLSDASVLPDEFDLQRSAPSGKKHDFWWY